MRQHLVRNMEKKNMNMDIKAGLELLKQYGFLQSKMGVIPMSAVQGNQISLRKSKEMLTITYDTKPHFYMALIRGLVMEPGERTIVPKAEKLGFMLDCSRNAVPKVEEIKHLICLLVLMGYTYLELYTEDVYELPGEPYFGYKRGRYSVEELREVVEFAGNFGMEVIPCIQTLAHLKNLRNWKPYFDHMDIDDILLVGDERTYRLIRKMLLFCKDVYGTERVHVGMDEAFHLGRGTYIDTFGYESKHKIYLEHLKRVFAICKEVGVKPEFWADGFYDTDLPLEEIRSIFDGEQTPIYWEYSIADRGSHAMKMRQLKEYAGKVTYAGGLWKWIGFAPDNAYSDKVMDQALAAAFACDVEDLLITTWGDNGAECSVYAVVPSMWHVTELVYPIEVARDTVLCMLTGYTDAQWRRCDELNQVMPHVDKVCNAMKYLMYNDYMIGLLDANIPDDAGAHYEALYPVFAALANQDNSFAYLFQTYAAGCRVLIHKATYSKRLYHAYQVGNKDDIRQLKEELQVIKQELQVFFAAYRSQWMKENKSFGFEVMDVRIGSQLSRIDTVDWVLEEYLCGRMSRIPELEEERIEYFCGQLRGEEVYAPLHNDWATAYTVNHL